MRAKELRKVVLAGVLILVIAWLSSLIWGLAGKASLAVSEANVTKAQYTELEARKNKLQSDLDALNTPRGQDAAIREAFGVAKSGEEVIVVVPPAAAATTSPPRPWWRKILNWF